MREKNSMPGDSVPEGVHGGACASTVSLNDGTSSTLVVIDSVVWYGPGIASPGSLYVAVTVITSGPTAPRSSTGIVIVPTWNGASVAMSWELPVGNVSLGLLLVSDTVVFESDDEPLFWSETFTSPISPLSR